LQCPYCSGDSNVLDSRISTEESGRQTVRRRRICGACRRRFTTYERLGPPNIKVQKRDGHHEPFDPDKIVRVLGRVCRDRPGVSAADHRRLASAIEAQLVDAAVKSIRSGEIALRLLALLKDVDRVAHDRLAADYLDENGNLRTDAPRPARRASGQLAMFDEEEPS
jgi:transcriptional repressor NrdR